MKTSWYLAFKRPCDIFVALTAIMIFLPVFLVVPVLIWLEDPGPIFFSQERFGLDGRMFKCLKFRSMYIRRSGSNEIVLTEHNDPRVTRIGYFLRRTSLDEIPQFFNVMKGEMSVVGPRPHPPGAKAGGKTYEEVVDRFMERYSVRPGITGWAQVNGLRGNTFTEDHIRQRFDYDMYYIKNWSLWFDFKIIIQTLLFGFTGKNAF